MFTSEELQQVKLFCCLEEAALLRLAQSAADVRLRPGEWLIREGEPPWFFALFEGRLRMVKDLLGRQQELFEYEYQVGDFFGETPLCLARRLWSRCGQKRLAAWPAWIGSSSRI